jgi:hypothetical protein
MCNVSALIFFKYLPYTPILNIILCVFSGFATVKRAKKRVKKNREEVKQDRKVVIRTGVPL